MNSGVLIFSDPRPEFQSLGSDFFTDETPLEDQVFHNRWVVAVADSHPQLLDIAQGLSKFSPKAQIILVSHQPQSTILSEVSKSLPIFAIAKTWSDQVPEYIRLAIDYGSPDEIESQLDVLAESEHAQLKNLSEELEQTVQRREKNLQKAQKRITSINKHVESLLSALQTVHQADSVPEVERQLLGSLKKYFDLDFIRILFTHDSPVESQLERQQHLSLFKTSLMVGPRALGKILFGRTSSAFSKSEEDFLHQVAEGVAISIDRLTKLEQAEHLKRQWESTFDSISEPLCLTERDFTIIKTNRAFSEVTQKPFSDLIGKNCFRAFIGKNDHPNLLSHDSMKFERRNSSGDLRTYEIHSQQIGVKKDSKFLMVMFRDITEQQKIERQIFESAKMAELGTVGSSIAHELNNPLGGMISFLQLIKMGLPDDDPIREDIVQMETAGKRCKEIIENLLGFSRSQDSQEDHNESHLIRIIHQTLKLAELKSRSAGVKVEIASPKREIKVNANPNLLAQALNHLLQNSLDAIEERSEADPRYRGELAVEVSSKDDQTTVTIRDNGVGIDPSHSHKVFNPLFSTKGKSYSGLGLTLAYKIITEAGGQLEISSQPNKGTEAKISLKNV